MPVELTDFEQAIKEMNLERAVEVFGQLTQWTVINAGLDPEDEILYVAAQVDGAVRGYCCFIGEPMELVILPETSGPFFLAAPRHVIDALDPTLSEAAIRWRRDCLLTTYREMVERSHLGPPPWLAFYSERPLGFLEYPAHVAVIVDPPEQGRQRLAITDGVTTGSAVVPVSAIAELTPLWRLEWTMSPQEIMSVAGRSGLHYVGLGPAHQRVGMLFNDAGGLLAWSAAASHCDVLASMADQQESGFTRVMLLQQLNAWQGRSPTV